MKFDLSPTITDCPKCGAALGVPSDAHAAVELECPACEARFALAKVLVRALPTARIAAPSAVDDAALPTDLPLHVEPLETPFAALATPLEADVHPGPPPATSDAVPAPPLPPALDEPTVESLPDWARPPELVEPAWRQAAVEEPSSFDDLPVADDFPRVPYEAADPAASTVSFPPAEAVHFKAELPAGELKASADELAARANVVPKPDNKFDHSYEHAAAGELASIDPLATPDEFSDAPEFATTEEFASSEQPYAHETPANDFDLQPAFVEEQAEYDDAPDADDDEFEHNLEDDGADDLDLSGLDRELARDSAWRQPRRRSSPVRSLAGIVISGIIGLLLAGYALIWLKGPNGDLLQLASWLPPAMLPASMQAPANGLALRNADRTDSSEDEAAESVPPAAPVSDPVPDAGNAASIDQGESSGAGELAANDGTPSGEVQIDPAVTPASTADPVTQESPLAAATAPTTVLTIPAEPAASAKPNWPSTPIVADLIEPRLYSLEELAAVASAADDAGRRFVAGDLSRPESVRDMGQAYIQLCAAAERLTLTDPAAYGPALFTQQALAKEPMHLAAGNEARRHDLAVISARWLQHAKRQNEGALFVGRVRNVRAQGPWTEHLMEIDYGDQKIETPVLMDKLRFATGVEAAVAGVIVKDPQRRIAGYQGDAPQVIVAGYTFNPARYADADASSAPDFELPDSELPSE